MVAVMTTGNNQMAISARLAAWLSTVLKYFTLTVRCGWFHFVFLFLPHFPNQAKIIHFAAIFSHSLSLSIFLFFKVNWIAILKREGTSFFADSMGIFLYGNDSGNAYNFLLVLKFYTIIPPISSEKEKSNVVTAEWCPVPTIATFYPKRNIIPRRRMVEVLSFN